MTSPPKAKFRPIMAAGTGSHVGKSVLAMGLCRLLRRRGLDVAPFKAQNMALNSGVTPQGGEMGRAQINQAEAAGLTPHTDMNPILLKPFSDQASQVIVDGQVLGNFSGSEYYALKRRLARRALAAFRRLATAHQIIVLEGAGSFCELNLKKHDLVNIYMAKRAKAKVVLTADISTGGVFAQLEGTLGLLTPSERRLVCGMVINKFRGDPALFKDGMELLEKHTGKPVLAMLPFFNHISLPQEDGVVLEGADATAARTGRVRVGVVRLSRVSNFTDADALAAEEAVELSWVERPKQLAGLDLLILPGTKNTLAALARLKETGLFKAVRAFHALGGKILGLCGGYQLLGKTIADPLGVEGASSQQDGLGLLPVETVMAAQKTTANVKARALPGLPFFRDGELTGYEIHMGLTTPLGKDRPAFRLISRLDESVELTDGQVSPDQRVVGTYLHGLLDNDQLRRGALAWARSGVDLPGSGNYADFKDEQYDLLADLMEKHLNLDGLLEPCI